MIIKIFKFLPFVFFLFLFGCNSVNSSTKSTPHEIAHGLTNKAEVTKEERTRKRDDIVDNLKTGEMSFFFLKNKTGHAVWVEVKGGVAPVNFDIRLIEKKLWEFASTNYKGKFEEPNTYLFQYQAISKDDVYIKAACDYRSDQSLSEVFLEIADGGSCYFSLKYNNKSKIFYDFYVHGNA